jgi:chromosome segregation ATPase
MQERTVHMIEQIGSSYEQLLQEWSFRRAVVNEYCNALRLLTPEDRDARQRWQELSGKLATAETALSQASAQLRSYEAEQALSGGTRH